MEPALPGAPSSDWTKFRQDTLRDEAAQLAPDPQARYQAWFLGRVSDYMNLLGPTAIAKQVRLGDFAAIRSRFAPPSGRGDWTIVWKDRNGLGPTKEPGEPFYFPTDASEGGKIYFAPDSNAVELVATCWHEVQHALLGEASLSAPGFHAADQEHFYIEGVAQNTVEWLWWLAVRLKFEDQIREAGAGAAEYARRGEPLTYAAERQLWAKAHAAWRQAWDKSRSSGKAIVAPEPALVAEYERLAGVRMPPVEEVIRFYMGGGVSDQSGKPISVPEWVMVAAPLRATVIIEKQPGSEKRTAPKPGGSLRHSFEITAREMVRPPRMPNWIRRPVARGTLTARLETDDDAALLAVHLGPTRIAGIPGPGGPSGRMIQIPLADHKDALLKGTPLQIEFIHGRPGEVRGKKSYRIVVSYEDTPAPPATESLYHPAEASYWIDLEGKPAAASPTKAPASTFSGATAPAREPRAPEPATANAVKGRWIMTRHWTAQERAPQGPTSFGFKMSAGDGQALTSVSVPDRNGGPFVTTFSFLWDTPPAVVEWRSESDPPQRLSASLASVGAPNVDLPWFGSVHFYTGSGHDPIPKPLLSTSLRDFKGETISKANVVAGKQQLPLRQEFTWRFYHPLGDPKKSVQVLTLRFFGVVNGGGVITHAHYEYRWQAAEAASPPPTKAEPTLATSVLRDEPRPAPQPDKGLDNEPPEPGEVVKVTRKPQTSPPPQPPKPKQEARLPTGPFYRHPSGDWEFALPRHFTDKAETDGETDVIASRDETLAVVCDRGFQTLDPGTNKQVLQQLERNWRKENPKATIGRLTLDGGDALHRTYRDEDTGSPVREIHLFGSKRTYTILLLSQPGTKSADALEPAEAVVRGLRFRR